MPPKRSPDQTFWPYVNKTRTCWLWTGSLTAYGHGHTSLYGRSILAHRASWIIHYGAILPGFVVCHQCQNKACVRPSHLSLGTVSDNGRDGNRAWWGTGKVLDYRKTLRVKPQTLAEAFWRFLTPGDPSVCWLWQGPLDEDGYGRFMFQATPYQAHRVSFLLHKGEIPKRMFILHQCDNPPCANPAHLRLGTPADNNLDMVQKRRHHHGEKHYKAKLNDEKVRRILALASNHTNIELAQMFEVSPSAITCLLRGVTWRHLTGGAYNEPGERQSKGTGRWNVTLTEDDVRTIRALRAEGALLTELAERFHVQFQTISKICLRKTWKHVP